MSVEVDDVTAIDPVGVASFDLVSRDRQGDQAIELAIPALDAAPYDRNDDTASFGLKLRSGRTYRITFKAEAYGFPILLIPNVEAAIRCWWDELSVTVDEEESVLLMDLDAALSLHDAEIKALLTGLGADLAEVKRLLNTPTGRRPEFPITE